MKSSFLALAVFALCSAQALAAPTLPVDQAVAIAAKYLQERNLGEKYYITSVILEADNARRSSFHWAISWSEAIPVNEQKKELGVEIAMDGNLTSLVKGPANRDPVTGTFNPNGNTGLQNPRTRTDRPSILDLKH